MEIWDWNLIGEVGGQQNDMPLFNLHHRWIAEIMFNKINVKRINYLLH
jgi:hypothetical protein